MPTPSTEPLTLAHVVWIGGAPAAGKTAVATRIASKHGLRLYQADTWTREHHRRAVEAGLPAAVRWDRATPDERWLDAPPRELAEWSLELCRGRFRMILEDLAALPKEPGVLVEGIPLLPWLVAPHLASAGQAVWLVPSPRFAGDRLRERPPLRGFVASSDPERASEQRIARERFFAAAVEEGVRELGLPLVRVDGSRDLDATVAAVEEQLAPGLARLHPVPWSDSRVDP